MSARRWSEVTGLLLVAVAVAYGASEVSRAPPWTVDDAYIVARYARHLVRAGVFAYDLEGPRVEGITSPLFALIAVVATAAGASAVSAMTAVGVAAYLVSGPLVYALGRTLRLRPLSAGVAACAYMAIPEHVTHARSGLETEAFLAAELACAWAFARAWSAARVGGRARALAIACLVVCLLRPEGFAVATVLVALTFVRVARRPTERVRWARLTLTWLAAPLGLLLVARLANFHEILPNSFYAKSRGDPSLGIWRDIAFLADAAILDFVVFALASILIGRLLGARFGRTGPRARATALAACALLVVFAAAYRHKDVMNYVWRFAMHTLPWLATLALLVVSYAASQLRRLARRRGRLVAWALPLASVPFVGLLWIPACLARRFGVHERLTAHAALRRRAIEPAAAFLSTFPSDTRLAVYADAGYLPYRTDFFTIDFGRINDRYLAREARSPEDVVRYFFEMAPDVAVFSNYGEGKLFNGAGSRILEDPRFAAYQVVQRALDTQGWGLTIYARPKR